MKFFPVLLAASLAAQAAPSGPGEAALEFLEKVRLGKVDLEPGGDTALSAQTAEPKKRRIERQLGRLALDLGADPLEVGAIKLDENFAGVLVRKAGGFDPGRLQVFPVALVKRGPEWMPAPVPASFENAGAGYAISLRKRLEALENWMLHEQVVDLERLREQSAERMRARIEASLPAAELRGYDFERAAERFLAACQSRDLPAMLGLLGGLAAELPADWNLRLKSAERAISAGTEVARPWRLLIAPEVIRVAVHAEDEGETGLISLVCLDPAGQPPGSGAPRFEVIHLELSKSAGGLWRVNPPVGFFGASRSDAEEDDDQVDRDPFERPEEPEVNLDVDLLDEFPAKWAEKHPPSPQPTAQAAHDALVSSLQSGTLEALLALTKSGGNPERTRRDFVKAAELWWSLRDPATVRFAMPLGFTAEEQSAAAVFQVFSTRDPDQLAPKTLYYQKTPAGWVWAPTPAAGTREAFRNWADREIERSADEWRQNLLARSPVIDDFGQVSAPTEDAARETVHAWLAATGRRDLPAALPIIARLADPRSGSIVLQNLGYEIIGALRGQTPPEITGIYRGDTWAAVGVKISQEGKPAYPLYPLVRTKDGPRILAEIDLFAAGNRGREFLNRAAFDRLRKFGDDAAADELKELYEAHQADVEAAASSTRD